MTGRNQKKMRLNYKKKELTDKVTSLQSQVGKRSSLGLAWQGKPRDMREKVNIQRDFKSRMEGIWSTLSWISSAFSLQFEIVFCANEWVVRCGTKAFENL